MEASLENSDGPLTLEAKYKWTKKTTIAISSQVPLPNNRLAHQHSLMSKRRMDTGKFFLKINLFTLLCNK